MNYDKDFFDQQFENYNEKEGNVWKINWRASQIRRHVLVENKVKDMLQLCPDRALPSLEIGCASGDFTIRYYELLQKRGRQLVCYDLSEKAVEICKKRFQEYDITFKQGNILSLTEPDECFDTIVCMDVLHYFNEQQWKDALKEIKRIKKKEGYALLAIPLGNEDEFGTSFRNTVKKQFEIISTDYVDNWFYQKYLEPLLLYIYNALNHEKIRKIVWQGFRNIVRKLLSSAKVLEVWIAIGKALKQRKNSHIILVVK